MFVTSRKVPDMISSVPGAEFLLRTNFGLGWGDGLGDVCGEGALWETSGKYKHKLC